MKHWLKRLWVFIMILGMFGIPSFAEETGKLTLQLRHTDEDVVTILSGTKVSIYKVWSYDSNNAIVIEEGFRENNLLLTNDMSDKTLQDFTPTFFAKVNASTTPFRTGVSDSEGNLVFDNLPLGGYLVVQDEPVEVNDVFYFMGQFLITLPYRVGTDGEFYYNPTAVEQTNDAKPAVISTDLVMAPKFRMRSVGINFIKIDKETKKVLPGATLVITNEAGEVVTDLNGNRCEWTTGQEKKTFYLAVGNYILKETVVPKGYIKADDIHFTVDSNYQAFVVDNKGNLEEATDNDIIMADPVEPPKTTPPTTTTPPWQPPPTSDSFNAIMYGGLFGLGLLLVIVIARRLKNN